MNIARTNLTRSALCLLHNTLWHFHAVLSKEKRRISFCFKCLRLRRTTGSPHFTDVVVSCLTLRRRIADFRDENGTSDRMSARYYREDFFVKTSPRILTTWLSVSTTSFSRHFNKPSAWKINKEQTQQETTLFTKSNTYTKRIRGLPFDNAR